MEKTIDATYDGEVFRPDEPVELPSNTKVRLVIEEATEKSELVAMPKKPGGKPYAFLDLALAADLDLPPDYASNIDEYLYGGKSLDGR